MWHAVLHFIYIFLSVLGGFTFDKLYFGGFAFGLHSMLCLR